MRLSRTFSSSHIPKKNPWIGTRVIRHLFLLSFVWQFANVIVICLADKFTKGPTAQNYDIGVAFMLFFQLLHLVFVMVTSIKLCKQVLHKTASPMFVVQSFLSTILLFAGLYTLLHRIFPNCFYGFADFQDYGSALVSIQIYIKFLYFSTATMTTVGYGDVTPTMWYTQLIVTCEMFLSVTFTVVIFAQGLSHFADSSALNVSDQPLQPFPPPSRTASTPLSPPSRTASYSPPTPPNASMKGIGMGKGDIPLSPVEAEGLSHFNSALVLEHDDEREDAPFISKKTVNQK